MQYDPISAMLSPVSDEEERQALADSLRGRSRAADFFALSTVGNIADAAKTEQANIQQGAMRGGILKNALEGRRQQAEQREFDRESREMIAEQNRLSREEIAAENIALREMLGASTGTTGRVTGARQVEDPEGNLHMVGYSRDGTPMNLATKEPLTPDQINTWTDYTAMSETSEARALEKLGVRSKTLNRLATDIENLDNILVKYADKGEQFEDIPGFGIFEKQSNIIGATTRLAQDLLTPGAEYGDNYAAAKSIINTINRERAGLAVTNSELQRIQEETGTDVLSSPGVFMKYYPRLKLALEEDFALIGATTKPRVLSAYREGIPEGSRDISQHKFRRFEWPETAQQINLNPNEDVPRETQDAGVAAQLQALDEEERKIRARMDEG